MSRNSRKEGYHPRSRRKSGLGGLLQCPLSLLLSLHSRSIQSSFRKPGWYRG